MVLQYLTDKKNTSHGKYKRLLNTCQRPGDGKKTFTLFSLQSSSVNATDSPVIRAIFFLKEMQGYLRENQVQN